MYIDAFMIGQTVDIIKDIVQQGRLRFFSYNWNYLAVATVVSYDLSYLLGLSPQVDFIVPDTLRVLALFLAFFNTLSFFEANTSIGPLLNAFTQMLIDVAKFFLYFSFVFLAFALSLTELYTLIERKGLFLAKPKQESNLLKLERCVQPCKRSYFLVRLNYKYSLTEIDKT